MALSADTRAALWVLWRMGWLDASRAAATMMVVVAIAVAPGCGVHSNLGGSSGRAGGDAGAGGITSAGGEGGRVAEKAGQGGAMPAASRGSDAGGAASGAGGAGA